MTFTPPSGAPLPPLNLNLQTSSGATASGAVTTVNRGSDFKIPALIIGVGLVVAVLLTR